MHLTEEQLNKFDQEGYLFFPSLFSKEEVGYLNSAMEEISNK